MLYLVIEKFGSQFRLLYATVSIEHINCSISLVLEHAIERENVLVGAVVRQVGVLDTSVSDGLLSGGELLGREDLVSAAFDELGRGPVYALVEQVAKTNCLARSRLELLLVFAEHNAEPDVLDAVFSTVEPADLLSRCEYAFEVYRLKS